MKFTSKKFSLIDIVRQLSQLVHAPSSTPIAVVYVGGGRSEYPSTGINGATHPNNQKDHEIMTTNRVRHLECKQLALCFYRNHTYLPEQLEEGSLALIAKHFLKEEFQ